VTFASIAALFVVIAGAAALIPALRAARLDPLVAVRDDS
jgi:ABC-type antimicrobial peptide transport system permease subunit